MTAWFGGGVAIRAVTRIALTSSAAIVYPGTTQEGCGGMAVVTIQCGCKVRRIGLGAFTFRGHTIMAGVTTVSDAGMIKYRAGERTGIMTDTAILNGSNMRDWFADGETSAMTR